MKKKYRPILHLSVCSIAIVIPLVCLAGRPGGGGGDVSRIQYMAGGMTYSMNADGSGKQLEATVALDGRLSARKYSGSRWQLSVEATDDRFEIYDDLNNNGQYDPETEVSHSFSGIEVIASRWTGSAWEAVQVTDLSKEGLRNAQYIDSRNVAWSNDGLDSFLSVRLTDCSLDADGRYLYSTSRPQYIARINISGAELDAWALGGLDPLITSSSPEFEIAAADASATIDNYTQVFASHSWSPDGSQLVIGDDGTSVNPGTILSVWDVATGNSQFILHAIDDFAGHSWAPDGSRILVHDGSDIQLINPDGSGLTTLLDGGRTAYYSHSFWSPDCKWIVYRKLTATRSICKIPVAGGKEVNLTKDLNGVQQWPLGWTPN